MKPNAFHGLAVAVCAASTVACGGDLAGAGGEPVNNQEASLASLESGATQQRAYVGVTQDVRVGSQPAVGTFDLLGGADVDIELATKDGAPLVAELWQVHVAPRTTAAGAGDGARAPGQSWATLALTVDEDSGFALHSLHADEDSSWLLRFAPGAATDVVVHIDCGGGLHGCTPFLQPGDRCPAGWQCDQGLTCEIPGDVCVVQ
jgi:hypothetical protein